MMKIFKTRKGTKIYKLLGGRSNIFLVDTGEQKLMIDSSHRLYASIIRSRLRNLSINHIDYLILTHTHFDHTGNAALIRNEFGAKTAVHHTEADFLRNGRSPLPGGVNAFSRWILKHLGPIVVGTPVCNPCPADILLNNGDIFPDKNSSVSILHTPGHSEGSVCIIIDDEFCIAGDTVFGIFPWSSFPPFADDVELLEESRKKMAETHCHTFLPAHGRAVSRKLLLKSNKV